VIEGNMSGQITQGKDFNFFKKELDKGKKNTIMYETIHIK
jgi:hypothetical protein